MIDWMNRIIMIEEKLSSKWLANIINIYTFLVICYWISWGLPDMPHKIQHRFVSADRKGLDQIWKKNWLGRSKMPRADILLITEKVKILNKHYTTYATLFCFWEISWWHSIRFKQLKANWVTPKMPKRIKWRQEHIR